jgi:signal transduction histidine kinase/ActR/RegA family two-component response regulator
MRGKDGRYRWILDQARIVKRDMAGKPLRMSGTHTDITERKLAEEDRERLQEQLVHAQKMDSIGSLAGGVAHDFNNMLSVILGHTELLLEQLGEAHSIHGDLREIQKAALRSADITRQLLAFARKQIVTPKVLDLNQTVESMLKMLRRLIGEDIDLHWKPDQNLASVRVDPSQIDQIMVNLCINSRDAIEGPGKLGIETVNVVFDEEYCEIHPGYQPGSYVMLTVSDDGCGMDRDTMEHLFEPFFTTKEVDKGTGLGLATVYGIVKQNSGFINVYSEPGVGTTFRIYLPQYRAKSKIAGGDVKKGEVVRGNETILLVEDERAILNMTQIMLERMGYRVIPASTPGEALQLARDWDGEIDLLLTDVIMPEMNGRELAKNLLGFFPQIKRLFMSGYTADVIAHHGVLDEGIHFIQKPFSIESLNEKVRVILDEPSTA